MSIEKYDEMAGELELNYIFFWDSLPLREQISKSDQLIHELTRMFRENSYEFNCTVNVDAEPLVCYFNTFIVRLNAVVKEGVIDEAWLFRLTEELINNAKSDFHIKLGLVLSENYMEYEKLENTIKNFSINANYSFYLTNAIKKMKKYNTFLLDLAKKAEGVLKVFAVTNLENIDCEVNQYFIEEGYEDNKYEQMLTDYVCSNINLTSYLENEVNAEKLDKLAFLLCKYLKNAHFSETPIKKQLIETYLPLVMSSGRSFYCLYSLLLIANGIEEDEENEFDMELAFEIKSKLNNEEWKEIFNQQLTIRDVYSEDLIEIADYYNYEFKFEDLYPYLLSDKNDFDVYFYFMKHGKEEDNLKLLKFFTDNFDIKKLTGSIKNVERYELAAGDIEDLLFAITIKAARELYPHGKNIAMLGLLGNINDVRKESLAILKKNKSKLTQKDIAVIKKVYMVEPNKKLKESMASLLGINKLKNKQFIKVDQFKVQPHVKDVYMFSTDITDIADIDAEELENGVSKQNICYLTLEKQGNDEENKIKVIGANGYVIGYVQEEDNHILSNLLQAGKYLYSRIKEYNFSENYIRMRVYLSYKDTLDQMEDILKMSATSKQNDYIN